jgi:hypothetical protein
MPQSESLRSIRTLWQRRARKLWPHAIRIEGDGPFALVTLCRDVLVSLWPTREDAERQPAYRGACGGGCTLQPVDCGRHVVTDLADAS